jgi:hypothetical protein
MKIKALRLLSRFRSDQGFQIAWLDRANEFAYVRASCVEGVFEQLIVKGAGKHREAIYADAAVSIVRGQVATKGLVELALLDELATDSERGYAIVRTDAQAIEWEKRFAELAPSRVVALAVEKGPQLLLQTLEARNAAAKYASLLSGERDLDELHAKLFAQATSDQRKEALRLTEWPGVLRIRGAENLYRTATLAIAIFSEDVEGRVDAFVGADPLENRELMWRIQILVDRLMIGMGIDETYFAISDRGDCGGSGTR